MLESALYIRMNGHPSDIRTKKLENPIAAHFSQLDHSAEDLEVGGIEKIHNNRRKQWESYWIFELKTLIPHGLINHFYMHLLSLNCIYCPAFQCHPVMHMIILFCFSHRLCTWRRSSGTKTLYERYECFVPVKTDGTTIPNLTYYATVFSQRVGCLGPGLLYYIYTSTT